MQDISYFNQMFKGTVSIISDDGFRFAQTYTLRTH